MRSSLSVSVLPSASRQTMYSPSGSRSSPCPVEEECSTKKEVEGMVKADEKRIGLLARDIFGPVPSTEEAESAVSALQRVCLPKNFSKLGGDEAASFSVDSFDRVLLSVQKVPSKVLDALHLLRLNPSVQRMVVSLASDKDVWQSIMKNEMVQELKKSYGADKYIKYSTGGIKLEFSDGCPYIVAQILGWLFENAKAKAMQIIEDILNLMNNLFHSRDTQSSTEVVSDVVRSSFMLSVLVLIIVILKRVDHA